MTKRVFVTVGTTKFDKLIETVSSDEILELLVKLGYKQVQFQVGNGAYTDRFHPNIDLKYDKYFEDFLEQIHESDLVISHAGAGSCLEVLRARKPLIVVVNEDLMDNHQVELAHQLHKDGYCYHCVPGTLKEVLNQDLNHLKPYPVPDKTLFSRYLDKCMGFT